MIFDKNASVARLSPDSSDNNKEAYVELSGLGNIRINIQPANSELLAVANGVYGQTYQAFVAISGISVGDRITVSGTGQKYIVKGVADWYFLAIPHLELILFKGDQ